MSHCVFHVQLFILIFYVLKLAFIDKHDPPPLCGSEILPIQRNQSINQSIKCDPVWDVVRCFEAETDPNN